MSSIDELVRTRSTAAKAQSLPVASRSSSRLRRRVSSSASRRMFWKSTAIFVHATSRPRTGLGARPFQASADRMSEAVNSAVFSGGRVDIRLCSLPRTAAESGRSVVVATTQTQFTRLYFPQVARDSRTARSGKQANALFAIGFDLQCDPEYATYRAQLADRRAVVAIARARAAASRAALIRRRLAPAATSSPLVLPATCCGEWLKQGFDRVAASAARDRARRSASWRRRWPPAALRASGA